MSLPLTTRFGADPLLDLELANKQYVDNSSGGGLTFAKVVKSVDETIQSNSTLFDDAELFFTPNINKIYTLFLFLFSNSGTTPDMKIRLTVPSGATAIRTNNFWQGDINRAMLDWTTTISLSGSATLDLFITQVGIVRMGGTAGTVNLQWAQNTSNGGDTTMYGGSLLVAYES